MIASFVAVFLLGVRHGADPDHVAAIDSLTRRVAVKQPRAGKFVGTLFAAGHAAMVLGIAAVIGTMGRYAGAFGDGLERAGTWLSVLVLVLMAAMNVRRMLLSRDAAPIGIRGRVLAPIFQQSRSALAALPIGFMFGLGFETSSQIAAYVMVASSGIVLALGIGAAFCAGMICTDTADSMLVSALIGRASSRHASRLWTWTVTLSAAGVALYETLWLLGIPLRIPELAISAAIVGALVGAYAYVVVRLRVGVDVLADP